MKKHRVGIDVGATNIKIGLFDEEMTLLEQMQTLTDQEADLDLIFVCLKKNFVLCIKLDYS